MLTNHSDKAVDVVVLDNTVCDVANGYVSEAVRVIGMDIGRWFCDDGTKLHLEPKSGYHFDWQMIYDYKLDIQGDMVMGRSISSKITGFNSGGSTSSQHGSSGTPLNQMLNSTAMGAWAFVRVNVEGLETIELPIWSDQVKYLADYGGKIQPNKE